tara:strand:- start:195 stop:311 length:117 start_codon:yes stop_codon:yes gene_type:complete
VSDRLLIAIEAISNGCQELETIRAGGDKGWSKGELTSQ